MSRTRLLHSGAFRLALLFALIFAAGGIVLVATVDLAVSRNASDTTDTALVGESILLRGETAGRGAALGGLIRRREQIFHARQFNYLLLDAAGRRIAGDLPNTAIKIGWDELDVTEPAEPNEPSDERSKVRTYAVRLIDGSRLVVGRDISNLQALSEWLRLVTFWSGLGITVLAVGGGFLIASIFLRRLERVNRSLQQIMGGRLDQRVPAIGLGDEFDRLTDNLNLMLARIEALMNGLRQVSTDIAHDLRTPLSRLRRHLESMRESAGSEVLTGAIDSSVAQLDGVLTTFHALLKIGQIEAGAGRARFSAVDLSSVMARVGDAYRTAAEDAGKILRTSISPAISVNGDPQLLAQLFVNLVENALAHGGAHAGIAMGLATIDGVVIATVSDDGPGIPAGERDRVQRRFYRLDASRTTPGSGLGLALVSAIAELHGAELVLEDNHPGLTVKVVFGA